MLQQGSQPGYWRKSPVPVRMQIRRSAQEELTQELKSPHSQWDQLDKCHQEQPGHAQSSFRRGRCSDSLGPSSPVFTGFLPFPPAALPYLTRGILQPMLLCSSPRKRHRLYLFWYIAVGSFNLCNRLREDFIQWGESNYCFICNQLPSQGLNLSELEGPVSPCTCLGSFCETGLCFW